MVPADPGCSAPEAVPPAVRAPYARLALTKYTDMQELLLLDPVHEVDDEGWPSRA